MIDGNRISSGLFTFFEEHMYPLVERGIIVKVVPPLYKITKGRKSFYVNTKKEYAEYVRKEISDNIEIYHSNGKGKQGDKLKIKEIEHIIANTIDYSRALNRYSRRLVCNKSLLELVTMHYDDLKSGKYNKFEKAMHKKWDFLKITANSKGIISINGVLDKEYQHLTLNKSTMGYIQKLYDTKIESKTENEYFMNGKAVLLSDVLTEFSKYEPKHKQRFKGLGEMNATELWKTTMTPEQRNIIRVTTNNYEVEMEKLRVLHSEKENYREERKKLLYKFKIDRDEIDS